MQPARGLELAVGLECDSMAIRRIICDGDVSEIQRHCGIDATCETAAVSVNVLDVNEPPRVATVVDLAVEENAPLGTVVGFFDVADDDGGQSFEVEATSPAFNVSAVDGSRFAIILSTDLDYEASQSAQVLRQASLSS